jgi:hypothetical protein
MDNVDHNHVELYEWCMSYGIKTNWNEITIHADGSIDVSANHVGINNKNITELPVQFNTTTHNFLCEANGLTTLKGCPSVVGRHFSCEHNKISTLHYCPKLTPGFRYNFDNNNLPEIVYKRLLFPDNHDIINLFVKYQDYYGVWDNGFNENGFNDLMADIDEGLDNWQRSEVEYTPPDPINYALEENIIIYR